MSYAKTNLRPRPSLLYLPPLLLFSVPLTLPKRGHEAERYLQATPPKALFEDMADKMTMNLPPDQRQQFKTLRRFSSAKKFLAFIARRRPC
jgi:hypothetical protein